MKTLLLFVVFLVMAATVPVSKFDVTFLECDAKWKIIGIGGSGQC